MDLLAKQLFFKKFFSNLLIIFQLAVFTSFINYTISMSNRFYMGYNDSYKYEDCEVFLNFGGGFSHSFDFETFEKNGNIIESNQIPIINIDKNILVHAVGKKLMNITDNISKRAV